MCKEKVVGCVVPAARITSRGLTADLPPMAAENKRLKKRVKELETEHRDLLSRAIDVCRSIRALEGIKIPYPEAMELSRCLKLIEAYLKEHGQ